MVLDDFLIKEEISFNDNSTEDLENRFQWPQEIAQRENKR
jgi:hypothetical protein